MSQQVNTFYMNKLDQRTYAPVYLVIFEGVPTRYSTGIITGAQGPTLRLVRNITASGAQITVDQGRTSLAGNVVELLDQKAQVTGVAAQYQLANRKVTIKAGFLGLDESKYVVTFVGRVNNYTLLPDNVTWSFDLVSLFTDTFPNIFGQYSIQQGAVAPGDVTINVDTTNGFPSATAGVCYLVIDSEVISYTGITLTSFTGCVRGQLGTAAASHSDKAQVNNFVVLQDNPLNLALQILTSTGLGTNGPYDVLPACAGLGIDQSLVDVATFENQRDLWAQSYTFRFEEFKSVVGKVFLEEQIYTFINAYPVINNAGQLSVHIYTPPLPSQINKLLTDRDLVEPPTYAGNVFSTYFFNEVDLSFDYDFLQDLTNSPQNTASGPYLNRTLYESPSSQAIFNTTATKTWKSRGMRTLITGATVINRVAERFLKRFSVPSPLMQAGVLYRQRLLENSDILPITSSKVPNLSTGKMGIVSKLFEILSITPDYMNGKQRLQLLDTGYSYGRKYAAISPSAQAPINFPNYLQATPQEKNYGFISLKINATTGQMSDGSDGYYITP